MPFAPSEHVPLAPLTTLGVGGTARYFVEGRDELSIVEALRWAQRRDVPTRILGGGSNVVVSDAGFDGLVVRVLTRGVDWREATAGLEAEAAAGEPWDPFVAEAVRRGAQGLECLSGIPGCVGATPIQNVGAYGQEVAESIVRVRLLDRKTLEVTTFDATRCRFAYRDSFFKSEAPERFVVLGVTFGLPTAKPPAVRYAELERRLERDATPRTLGAVRATVLALRAEKSMLFDTRDENGRSCGSFFVNPVVSAARADAIAASLGATAMPRYPQPDGRVKLAAGWLIERAGFSKGTRRGTVGLSTKHALAIVCHEGARAADVERFANEIRSTVNARFGVELVPEPVFFGSSPQPATPL